MSSTAIVLPDVPNGYTSYGTGCSYQRPFPAPDRGYGRGITVHGLGLDIYNLVVTHPCHAPAPAVTFMTKLLDFTLERPVLGSMIRGARERALWSYMERPTTNPRAGSCSLASSSPAAGSASCGTPPILADTGPAREDDVLPALDRELEDDVEDGQGSSDQSAITET